MYLKDLPLTAYCNSCYHFFNYVPGPTHGPELSLLSGVFKLHYNDDKGDNILYIVLILDTLTD